MAFALINFRTLTKYFIDRDIHGQVFLHAKVFLPKASFNDQLSAPMYISVKKKSYFFG